MSGRDNTEATYGSERQKGATSLHSDTFEALRARFPDARRRPFGRDPNIGELPPDIMFTAGGRRWAVMVVVTGRNLARESVNSKFGRYEYLVDDGHADAVLVVSDERPSGQIAQRFADVAFPVRHSTLGGLATWEPDPPRAIEDRAAIRAERAARKVAPGVFVNEPQIAASEQEQGLAYQVAQIFSRFYHITPRGAGFEFSTGPAAGRKRWMIFPLTETEELTRARLDSQISTYKRELKRDELHGLLLVSRLGLPPEIPTPFPFPPLNVRHRTLMQLLAGDFGLDDAPQAATVGSEVAGVFEARLEHFQTLGRAVSTRPGTEENRAAQEALEELAARIRGANAPILRASRNEMLAVEVEAIQRSLTLETVREQAVKLYQMPLVKWLAEKVILPVAVKEAAKRARHAMSELFPQCHHLL